MPATGERRSWTDEENVTYTVERIGPRHVSVSLEVVVIGEATADHIPPLDQLHDRALQALIATAIRERELGRWENEGGHVPD